MTRTHMTDLRLAFCFRALLVASAALTLMQSVPARARAATIDRTTWRTHLQTATFQEGDAFGTTVQDLYIDAADPGTNKNGLGLNLRWTSAAERPGYIKFSNSIFDNIPVGSFIYSAKLELTASSTSTGAGYLKVGSSNANYTEASTYSGGTAVTNRAGLAGVGGSGGFDQLYSRNFNTTLVAGNKVEIDISGAARSWFDNFQNPSHGYLNKGLSLNVNTQGAGPRADNSVLFFDSENATLANRPKLTIEYLAPDSGYKAVLFTNTPTNTSQVRAVTVEDTVIRFDNPGNPAGENDANDNFGGALSIYGMRTFTSGGIGPNDLPSVLLRYNGFSFPEIDTAREIINFVDADLRFSTTDNWSDGGTPDAPFAVRELLRNWVQGVGNATAVAGATFNSFNRAAGLGGETINLWQVKGAHGTADVDDLGLSLLATLQGETLEGSVEFAEMIARWLEGGTNNGLAIQMLPASDRQVNLLIGSLGANHFDPYLSPGIIAVFQIIPIPEPSTAILLSLGSLLLVAGRRRRAAA